MDIDSPFIAQLFGEGDDHWLLKVGKTPEAEFELDEGNPELNKFFVIFFKENPPKEGGT